jgi:hypothetical protein
MILLELRRTSLEMIVKQNIVRYWIRIITSDSSLVKRCLDLQYSWGQMGRGATWGMMIRNILQETGFMYVWKYGPGGEWFFRAFRQRTRDMDAQIQLSKCRTMASLESYCQMEEVLPQTDYILGAPNKFTRMQLAYLRSGSWKWKTLQRLGGSSQYICPFCEKKETEVHMIFWCMGYQDARLKYLPPNLRKAAKNRNEEDCMDLLLLLFQKNYYWKDFSRLIAHIFQHRDSALAVKN